LNLLIPAGAADARPTEEAPAVTAARAALERREHPRALDLLQERLRQEPGDQGARRLLVRTYLDLGQGRAAEEALEPLRGPGAAAVAAPVLAPADLADLGQALLLQGQFLRLIGSIDPGAAKGKDPRPRAELSALVGEAHLNLGELKAARVRLAEARTLDPANTRALYGLARLALADKDRAGAAALVEQALAVTPTDPKGLELKGDLAFLAGERATAEEAFGQAITHRPNPGTLYYKRAMVRIDLNAFPGAAADLREARAQVPDFLGLDLAEGMLALRRGDPQAAVPHLEAFLTSAPATRRGSISRAWPWPRPGATRRPCVSCAPCWKPRRRPPRSPYSRPRSCSRRAGRGRRRRLLAAAPGNLEAGLTLAQLDLLEGAGAAALTRVLALAQAQPRDARVQTLLANALAATGDLPGARAAAERALASDPRAAGAALTLARLALQAGDLKAARAPLETLLRANATDSVALVLWRPWTSRTANPRPRPRGCVRGWPPHPKTCNCAWP